MYCTLLIYTLNSPLLDLSDFLGTARLPLQLNTLPLEDRELCASTAIARYRIKTGNSDGSLSALYTAPNTPSFPPLHPSIMDENQSTMALDADDCIARLESGLFDAREQARAQQNTLNNILQLLQRLPALGDSHIPRDTTTASRVPILVIPMSDPTPHVRAHGLKPARS